MIRTYFENTRCDLAEVSGFLLGSWSKIQELTCLITRRMKRDGSISYFLKLPRGAEGRTVARRRVIERVYGQL